MDTGWLLSGWMGEQADGQLYIQPATWTPVCAETDTTPPNTHLINPSAQNPRPPDWTFFAQRPRSQSLVLDAWRGHRHMDWGWLCVCPASVRVSVWPCSHPLPLDCTSVRVSLPSLCVHPYPGALVRGARARSQLQTHGWAQTDTRTMGVGGGGADPAHVASWGSHTCGSTSNCPSPYPSPTLACWEGGCLGPGPASLPPPTLAWGVSVPQDEPGCGPGSPHPSPCLPLTRDPHPLSWPQVGQRTQGVLSHKGVL